MSERFLMELERENLCTHFILPLLKLNKFSFIVSNFVNCFLSTDRTRILVQVADTQLLSRRLFRHPDFQGLRGKAQGPTPGLYFEYKIPPKWRQDVELFCAGKFSKMSKAAKDTIIRHSGLPHRERYYGRMVSDGRLLALEKHEVLKSMWEETLGADLGDLDLLSIPGEDSYIPLDTLIPIKEARP